MGVKVRRIPDCGISLGNLLARVGSVITSVVMEEKEEEWQGVVGQRLKCA